MCIQYVGFNVADSSRTYNFDVIGTEETREFTVKVQSEAFRPAGLKLQDGPDICFRRLQQELQGETQEARAQAHLSIGEQNIQEYMAQRSRAGQSSRKKHQTVDGRTEGVAPARGTDAPRFEHAWQS